MNYWTKHSLPLNIRSTSPSPAHKKKLTLYMRGKKSKTVLPFIATSQTTLQTTPKMLSKSNTLAKFYNNFYKERIKRRKCSGDANRNDSN